MAAQAVVSPAEAWWKAEGEAASLTGVGAWSMAVAEWLKEAAWCRSR